MGTGPQKCIQAGERPVCLYVAHRGSADHQRGQQVCTGFSSLPPGAPVQFSSALYGEPGLKVSHQLVCFLWPVPIAGLSHGSICSPVVS